MIFFKDLPFPPSVLNPNRSGGKHWGQMAAIKKEQRELGRIHATGIKFDQDMPLAMIITMHQKRTNYDMDNVLASLKSYLDGVCQGAGTDDQMIRQITMAKVHLIEKKLPSYITIRITEL